MKPGPRREPTGLKVANGTYRPDLHGDIADEPAAEFLGEIPEPPECLGVEGRMRYLNAAKNMLQMGILTAAELDNLESYGLQWEEFARCQKDLDENGYVQVSATSGLESERPTVKQRDRAFDKIMRLNARFGFSPSDRAGLPVAAKTDHPSKVSSRKRG